MRTEHELLAMDVADRVSGLLHRVCDIDQDTCQLIFCRLSDALTQETDRVLIDLLLGLRDSKAANDFIAIHPVTGEQCEMNRPDSLLYRRMI